MTVPSTTRSKPSSTMASQQSHTGHRDLLSNDVIDIATSGLFVYVVSGARRASARLFLT